APHANEVLGPLLNQYPTPVLAKFVPDAAGFLYIDYAAYPVFFAPDIPRKQAEGMAVAQKPLNGVAVTQTNPAAAWRTIPSCFMVAKADGIITRNAERFFGKRMNAKFP